MVFILTMSEFKFPSEESKKLTKDANKQISDRFFSEKIETLQCHHAGPEKKIDLDTKVSEDSMLNTTGFGIIAEPEFESKGAKAVADICNEICIWDAPIGHAMQVELLQILKRIMEHFYWSSMSIRQSRPFDAACIILPGCIAAIADSILRRRAFDHPSEVCTCLLYTSDAADE